MADLHNTHSPLLNLILFTVASFTGGIGMINDVNSMDLQVIDQMLAIILKLVSIVSFILIIALNFGKVIKLIKTWVK